MPPASLAAETANRVPSADAKVMQFPSTPFCAAVIVTTAAEEVAVTIPTKLECALMQAAIAAATTVSEPSESNCVSPDGLDLPVIAVPLMVIVSSAFIDATVTVPDAAANAVELVTAVTEHGSKPAPTALK